MKYKIENMFDPSITDVELSEKELAYMTAVASGVTRKQALQVLQLKAKDVKDLYLKFGLMDLTKSRVTQMITIAAINRLINKNTFLTFGDKYGFMESREFGESL